MIPEIGQFALILALVTAIVQGSLPLYGAHRHDAWLIGLAPRASYIQFLCMTLAFGCLIAVYVLSDFSVKNVFANSHSAKPLVYKISGAWGNHEGSLVMWVWILSLYGAAVAWFGAQLPRGFRARVLAVQGLIAVGFLLFMLVTSNPFERLLPVPLEGRGLNPILQDPGLAIHPPMLYLGYVGFSMAFAFAVAALIEGRVDASWARWVRPWTLAAWIALTLGIALGSWWAYYELGWGGWWFWDPVENASFMPWLAGTALIHSAIVVEKRDTLKSWTILLAILTFSLSLLGTFLVRSGVLTSVHAFASDPDRGVFILALLIIAIGGSLMLYAWRMPKLAPGGLFAPISREGGLVLNNILLATACATVLLGTLYPLFLDVLDGPKISVGPPYFNATFIPLMIPLILALPMGTLMPWKRGDVRGVLQRLVLASGAAVLFALITLVVTAGSSVLGAIGIALGVWTIVGALTELLSRAIVRPWSWSRVWARFSGLPRAAFGMAIAHVGLGVLIMGITASSVWRSELITSLAEGESRILSGYEFALREIVPLEGPNYQAQRALIDVSVDGELLFTLTPEKRFYRAERQQTSEAGIDTGLMRDVYAVLGEAEGNGRFGFRFYVNPLVFWIWGGIGLMAVGGGISLTDRRLRVGAARRSKAPAAAAGLGQATA